MYYKQAFLFAISLAFVFLAGCPQTDPEPDNSEDGNKEKKAAAKVIYRDEPIAVTNWQNPPENLVGSPWEAEHWNNVASAQLEKLGQVIVHAKTLTPTQIQQQLNTIFAAPVSFSGLKRADLKPLFKEAQLEIVGADPQTPVTKKWPESTATQAIGALISPWNKCDQRRFVFEIDNVVVKDQTLTTDALISIVGEIPKIGARQASMNWKISWEFSQDKKNVNIKAIQIASYDETTLLNPATSIYSDCTGSVFENTAPANKQFSFGISQWTEKLGTRRIMGWHGISICDVNNDDLDDIYVSQPEGIPNRLFVQVADGTVRDASLQSGLAFQESTGATLFADLDNDGDQDALISLQSGVALLANDGKGRFHYKRVLFNAPNITKLTAADFDRDGDLDLLCAGYLPQFRSDSDFPAFNSVLDADNGGGLVMYVNDGNLNFKLIAESAGIKNRCFIVNAFWHDTDLDGDLDIVGANDFAPATYLNNKGDWFAKGKIAPGLEQAYMYRSFNWIDLNADGESELIVSTGSTPTNRLVANAYQGGEDTNLKPDDMKKLVRSSFVMRLNKDRQYEIAERLTPVPKANFTLASDTFDVNGDGIADLLSTNSGWTRPNLKNMSGYYWRHIIPRLGRDNPADKKEVLSQKFYQFTNAIHGDSSYEPGRRNSLLLNTGRNRLVDISAISGLDDALDTRSLAKTDWDSDGDWDLVQYNALAPMIKIKRNNSPPRPYVKIKLRGTTINRDGYGAIVNLFLEGSDKPIVQTSKCESLLLTQSSRTLIFSIPENAKIEKVVVKWSAKKTEEFFGFKNNQMYCVIEGDQQIQVIERPEPASKFVPKPIPHQYQVVRENLIWPKLKGPELEIKTPGAKQWMVYAGDGRMTLIHLCKKSDPNYLNNLSQLATLKSSLRKIALQDDGLPPVDAAKVEPAQISASSIDRLRVFGLEVFANIHSFQSPCWILLDDSNRIAAVYRDKLDPQSVERDINRTAKVVDDFYQPFPLYETKRISNLLVPDYIRLAEIYGRAKYKDEVKRMRLLSREQLALARCQMAQSFLEQGNLVEARKMIRQSLGYNKNCREAYLMAGKINLRLAKRNTDSRDELLEKASQNFSDALDIDEKNVDARIGLAEVAERRGKFDEAIGIIDAAIRNASGQGLVIDLKYRLNWIKGRLLYRKKDYHGAASALTEAFDLRPIEVALVTDLALVYSESGDFKNALRFFRLARRLSPNELGFTRIIGVCYFLTGHDKEAIEEFQKVIDKSSRDYATKLMLAWILATSPEDQLRDGKRAMKIVKPIYDVFGDTEVVFKEVYAAVLAENGDLRAAKFEQQEAVDLQRSKVRGSDQSKYLEGMQQRLKTYRSEKPIRMTDRGNHPFPRITDVQRLTGDESR